MNWLDQYKSKVVMVEEAVKVVKSKDRIFLSGNAATPLLLTNALANRAEELSNVEVNHILLLGDDPLSKPGMAQHFRHNSLFVGPGDRQSIADGNSDYVPVHLSQVPALFCAKYIPLDVAFIHVSPPDAHGFMSFGAECAASKAAAENAKIVVAQVNERMPRTLGDVFIHVSRVHKIVECSVPILELHPITASEIEERIADFIAPLIEDNATLQLGIGGIPDAVLARIEGTIVATAKHPTLDGCRFLVARRLEPDGTAAVEPNVVVDWMGAAKGETVLISTDGDIARLKLGNNTPARMVVVGLVDAVQQAAAGSAA